MLSGDYLAQLLALLPPGRALSREPDDTLVRLLGAPAAELARVEARGAALLAEADPRAAEELLPDWERVAGLPDPCSPNVQFSRASVATWFDGAGVLRSAGVDQPRYLFDAAGLPTDALLLEAAGQNAVRNPLGVGAAIGVLATNWAASSVAGIAVQQLGLVTVDGWPVVRTRWLGTATAAGSIGYWFDGGNVAEAAAALGQVWTATVFVALAAAGQPVPAFRPIVIERAAGGAYVTEGQGSAFTPDAGPIWQRRQRVTRTVAGASTTHVQAAMFTPVTIGLQVDLTLDLALPQLERGAEPTTPMLPAAGTIAAATRAADVYRVATVAQRRARLAQQLTQRLGASPAFFVQTAAALGQAVTVTEHREYHCELSCEAPVADTAWAFAWTVNAPATTVTEATAEDGCETPLAVWGDSTLDCVLRRLAPAHTTLLIAYS